MKRICGYEWLAPHHRPGDVRGKPTGARPQTCSLKPKHEGDHRSELGITTPKKES